MKNLNFLGKKSYPYIVSQIFETIQKAKCDTIQGQDMLNDIYSKLNESITPMLELKQFITGAEKVAGSDATLYDVIKFCKKSIDDVDLNFIINLCKEEHYANLSRAGFPNPEATLKDIEEEFDKPVSMIEQGIVNGIFDKLDSKLFNNIKLQFETKVNPEAPKDDVKTEEETISDVVDKKTLNESVNSGFGSGFGSDLNGNISYNPVGIVVENKEINSMVILVESDVLSWDTKNEAFNKITIDNLEPNYVRLMEAIEQAKYFPETEMFSLNENWDFNLRMRDGIVYVGKDLDKMKEIPKDKIQSLLLESINEYTKNPTIVEGFNRANYVRDADNFVMLVENNHMLTKLDNIKVIRNLNESNKYLMFDIGNINKPSILSINGIESKTYDSFNSLCESVINQYDCKPLFESQLLCEQEQIKTKFENIDRLKNEQKSLNENINKAKNLMTLCDEDSPAMDKLKNNLKTLNESLNSNLEELNFYQNEFSLYE